MTKNLRALTMVAALLGLTVVPAQAQRASQSNDAKLKEQRARTERDVRRYEKLKAFAQNLYQTDPDFRDEVDAHYDEVQRQHSLEAFNYNAAEPARPTVVHDGDRLRLRTASTTTSSSPTTSTASASVSLPVDSERLFAFRLLANPIPSAYTLSTGTIYISTGLVSLLDNEAQLAYVLAHEMGHVQFDHWKLKSTLALAQEEFAAKDGRRRAMWGAVLGAAAGATVGGMAGNSTTAVQAGRSERSSARASGWRGTTP